MTEPVRLLRHLGTRGARGYEHHRAQQWGKEEGLPGCRSTKGWGTPPLTPPAAELLQGFLWAKPSQEATEEEVIANQIQACGLQSSPLQDREGHRVNLEVGGAGQADRTVSTDGDNYVHPRRTKEMSHVFCFLVDPYKFLK